MSTPHDLGGELSTREFWSRPVNDRAEVFARLRREAPVSFQPPLEFAMFPFEQGYWAVTSYDDVVSVSRQPEVFSSARGITLEDLPVEILEMIGGFILMDPPRHDELRRVVSKAFTPRRVAALEEGIRQQAKRFVAEFVERADRDTVADLAVKLPLWTLSEMLGVPDELRPQIDNAVHLLDEAQGASIEGVLAIVGVANELAAARRAQPADDLVSVLVESEFEGEKLSDLLVASTFLLLAFAGNDTTRAATSHGLKLFSDHPDQWAALRAAPDELLAGTVEEVLRCATPVIQFRRTATRDAEIRGVPVADGEHVVVFYESANRDDAVFDDPLRFDIRRAENHHLAFGGGGPHFCVGASLARTELRALFRHLAESCTEIHAGHPTYLVSSATHNIQQMPLSVVTSERART